MARNARSELQTFVGLNICWERYRPVSPSSYFPNLAAPMATFLAGRLSRWLPLSPTYSTQLAHTLQKSRKPTFSFCKETKRFIHSTPVHAANGKVKHAISPVQRSNLPGTTGDVEKAAEKPVKSRNQKKRDAARAFYWGMELAKLSPAQLKRIVRAASLQNEVIDAVMLVKKLGSDVREGKRRQFNYIGGLLRNVQPELMETLLQATKDGDMDAFHAISRKNTEHIKEDMELEEDKNEEEKIDEEVLPYMEIVKRWSQGLISGDASITKEVYSMYTIDFDRQELRNLVRRAKQEAEMLEENSMTTVQVAAVSQARNLLNVFLCKLANRRCTDSY